MTKNGFASTQSEASWDDLRLLLVLARTGSLLAAGQSLGVAPSTISRRLAALEAALGRKLVHRTSAGTSIEPGAAGLLALADELDQRLRADQRARGHEAHAGVVRISCPEAFAAPVTRVLAGHQRTHPDTAFEVIADARVVDLDKREADVAIRTVRSKGKTLVERRVARFPFALWASDGYLERRLRDGHLRAGDFGRHDFIGHEGALRQSAQERWLRAQGARSFPFRSSSDAALVAAAAEGRGICIVAEPLAAAAPSLRKLRTDPPLPAIDIFLVVHRELRQVPRIRATLAALTDAIGAVPGRS
jgi:DNA-binding transcriptional LysR family regulator